VSAAAARGAAQALLARKTMPSGALGRIEWLAAELAAIHCTSAPDLGRVRALLFAADHGVSHAGVSAYPRAVTAAMLGNFARGGAAAAVLARTLDVELEVIDVGVDSDAPPPVGVVDARIARGSADLRSAPALGVEHCLTARAVGAAAVARAGAVGALVLGEMGIGNTTSASALLAALTGADAATCTGPGTGVSGAALAAKRAAVACAIARVDATAGAEALLAELGGYEIAAMVGAIHAAAERRVPVLVDGFIVGVAALVAVRMRPDAREVLLFAHRSAEPAHGRVLDELGAEPLLDLGLRLGEGSGALLAVPLLRAAAAILTDMASFDDAGVPDRAR
jgi:nicotinate-nucleotide--dimethylbenzimidazole phosphoribosyltransferase